MVAVNAIVFRLLTGNVGVNRRLGYARQSGDVERGDPRRVVDTDQSSVGIYHKDIKSFIQDLTIENFDFRANGFVVPETYEAVVTDEETGGRVVTPVEVRNGAYTFAINNKEGGYIR